MCTTQPCYPVYTAEGCMTRPQQVALGALTLALAAVWLPLAWAVHLLSHSYPAEHPGCRWCHPGRQA